VDLTNKSHFYQKIILLAGITKMKGSIGLHALVQIILVQYHMENIGRIQTNAILLMFHYTIKFE
jgi:hypothetical protein